MHAQDTNTIQYVHDKFERFGLPTHYECNNKICISVLILNV